MMNLFARDTSRNTTRRAQDLVPTLRVGKPLPLRRSRAARDEDRDNPWHPVLLCLALMVAVVAPGCSGDAPGTLTIATALPAADRARLEKGFAEWSARNHVSAPVRWVLLAPGDDQESVARHRNPPDVILVSSDSVYVRLTRAGLLDVPAGDNHGNLSARRGLLGLVSRAGAGGPAASRLTFDDPRRDPISFAWARACLGSGHDPLSLPGEVSAPRPGYFWADGYARLVRAAASHRPPGRQPGAALAALERGEADAAPGVEPKPGGPLTFEQDIEQYEPAEWAAAVKGALNPEAARAFLRYLSYVNKITQLGPTWPESANPDADALLADLLGATLVDAHDELRVAILALERRGHPENAERWLTLPPPWPPASVARILGRESNAMPLIETLAAQLAPDPDVRAWLLRSWLAPGRSVDGALLDELAGAVDGGLVREPRFRAWLRSEWTAWARQRYRRVARLAQFPEAARP
jgi:hypothetical protein